MSTAAEQNVIAIDGPGGSGKSTVARLVAEATAMPFLNTGAMYRAVTFSVLRREIDPGDVDAVADAVETVEIDLSGTRVLVDGVDATEAIRGPEVTASVSAVAANPAVRSAMVRLQQEWIAGTGGGVLEGRDIGTVVAPHASLKVFVTATVEERARRRAAETGDDVAAIADDLRRRDEHDSNRAVSPLRIADDAIEIDTTGMTIDEVVATVVELAAARGLEVPA